MKTFIATFDVPECADSELSIVREYVEEALNSLGGAYLPGHPFFQLRKLLSNIEVQEMERPAMLRRFERQAKGFNPAAPQPILGQRCIVRQPDSDPFLGVVIDHDSTAFCVRHAISKVDQWFVRAHVELLAP